MKVFHAIGMALAITVGLCAGLAVHGAADADLVIYNAKVLTVDKAFSIKSAVAVKDGKIVAVGSNEIAKQYSAPTKLDLHGRVLMPGFTDTHVHIFGLSRRGLDLEHVTSITQLQDMLRDKAEELGPGEWITGRSWDEFKFAEKRVPHKEDLDKVTPNNPVVLVRAGGHSSVGNSAALKLAGVDKNTPDPKSGLIEHEDNGDPNGVIRERSDLYTKLVPQDKWTDLEPSFVKTLKYVESLGITSLFEASGTIDDEPADKGGMSKPPTGNITYQRIRSLYDRMGGDLPRMVMYISYPGPERLKAYPHHTGYGDDQLKIGPIGESAVDGGFTGPTAWVLVDYKGMPGFRGKGRYTDDELKALVDTSGALGWQVGLHAIGDAAIQQAVMAYDQALETTQGMEHQGKDRRWFTDHFTIMPPTATMETMKRDNIMIAQQPNFEYTLEGRYMETMDDFRVEHNNSVVTPVKKYNLFMAFGSDNLPIGPMVGLYAAVTRKGLSGAVHGPEEAVSLPEAIRMYTANGPYLSWDESKKGTLEVGKFADMIVLPEDILTVPHSKLLNMKVDMTFINGKLVYDRSKAN